MKPRFFIPLFMNGSSNDYFSNQAIQKLPRGFCVTIPIQDTIDPAYVMSILGARCGHRWTFYENLVPYELGFYPGMWNPVIYSNPVAGTASDGRDEVFWQAIRTLYTYPELAWDIGNEPDGNGYSARDYAKIANYLRDKHNATISCCSIILNQKPPVGSEPEYYESGLKFMEDFFAAGGKTDAISIHVYPMFSVDGKSYKSDLERANALWDVWRKWYKVHGRGLPVIVTEYSGSYDGDKGNIDMMNFMADKIRRGEVRAAFYYSARYIENRWGTGTYKDKQSWLFDASGQCNVLCRNFRAIARTIPSKQYKFIHGETR